MLIICQIDWREVGVAFELQCLRNCTLSSYCFFYPQVVKIPEVKIKVKNQSVEWLHVRVDRGSQKAVAIKNRVVSVHNHAEPLEEELGLAIITRPL